MLSLPLLFWVLRAGGSSWHVCLLTYSYTFVSVGWFAKPGDTWLYDIWFSLLSLKPILSSPGHACFFSWPRWSCLQLWDLQCQPVPISCLPLPVLLYAAPLLLSALGALRCCTSLLLSAILAALLLITSPCKCYKPLSLSGTNACYCYLHKTIVVPPNDKQKWNKREWDTRSMKKISETALWPWQEKLGQIWQWWSHMKGFEVTNLPAGVALPSSPVASRCW